MANGRIHADEVDTDEALVRRLIAGQFPQWAELPVRRFDSAGTVNAIYRLGDDLSVRLPLTAGFEADLAHELTWLPRLRSAAQLPLGVPEPRGRGEPAEGYPFTWAVYAWLEGENPTEQGLSDPVDAALELAGFVRALRAIDPSDGPRGVGWKPLSDADTAARAAIREIAGIEAEVARGFRRDAMNAAWDDALAAPPWNGEAAWVHGDLLPGNLLALDGRISAVIDFGCVGVGDPSRDLLPAWSLLPKAGREAYREALDVGDGDWARGRGAALEKALMALPYYRETNPGFAAVARTMLREVLADLGAEGMR